MVITSTSNPRIKRLVNLRKKRKARDEEQVFIVEGIRMFREVPEAELREVYVSESFYKKEQALTDELCQKSNFTPEIVSDHVFDYMSDTRNPQGVLCVVRQMAWRENTDETRVPLLLLLDNLQDPGNMGTIIRSAEGAGVTGIIMSRDCVDIYNPKTIRSTMGSIYRMPFRYVDDIPEAVQHMKAQGIHTYAAHLAGESSYEDADYRTPSAFFIGNEGNGLREEVASLADTYIKIPMEGQVESLNAAIAATVLMFEASRQRRRPS